MGHLFNQFPSWYERKILANIGPGGDPIATPSTWIKNLLLNVKKDSLVAKFSKSRKSFLDIPLTKVSGVLKSFFTQISIVSSNGMLVNKASTSKLAIWRSLFWVKISSTKVKESRALNSFCVISDRTETKSFVSLYVGVPISHQLWKFYSNVPKVIHITS